MSYLALARKWRPRTFSQLVGQDHINKALINALNQQRLHHAYLFTGTRGVGKTSIARILAKSLNCEKGISSEPCLQCTICNAIEQGRFIDLIEIDGASKTRVEDTRDLLDNVQYAPAIGRFKIYLIDEVHMLSQHSFNALLKTLEEPPAHVKFILATTDPQKLPVTVLSRCLQFNLKHLATEVISHHLQQILMEEQLDFEVQAADILAQAARGSMRDALSLLDQAITGCDTQLRANDVKMILGYTQQDYALQMLCALAEQNAAAVLKISQCISIEGGHFQYVLDELLNYLHQIAICQTIGDNNPLISPPPEIITLAQHIPAEDIQLFYQIGLKGREEIHLAPTLIIGFNMTVLRMLTFRPVPKETPPPLASYKTSLPSMLQSTLPAQEIPLSVPEQQIQNPANSDDREKKEQPQVTNQEDSDWASIIPHLKLTGLALNAAENAELVAKNGREITLRVAKGHQSLFTPTILSRIEVALGQYYQNQVKIILNSDESVQSSPAQQKEQAMQQKQLKAEAALNNDPMFQQLQQEFSAELVKNSIVPLKDDL
ncbi:TPA: DNA polymerase III subunit gamma/tau [Legionella anisa]|uniref:DNA polymerase III subunit gamma/tau n=1 Tax=Legionella anisa TaxID=28082 RepID=A0AAX0WZ52_9GAMM|nr:DNA polymerase III subunit gamma/tau [Legionella anisa]AWN75675.1 DNA polymerase III subunit gamma/tau [Legionella anisa]MBN5935028.1 DNA polymerase III subunit gamma/tau [Legionella anisa]MCW8423419.1 DNA polymerase III subunit gamma/tau [Legionella anisa]MCW8446939.1 DNA polymerase III subunit gamma/tau [Legionella anisa]PNL63599.1 DNA polymerase III subunit gamma/tau [Legionella anisa]